MEVPFQTVTDEVLSGLRTQLVAVGYTEHAICARLAVPTIFDLKEAKPDPQQLGDALDVLICLFAAGCVVPADEAAELVPERLLGLLGECGLVRRLERERPLIVPNVSMFPIRGTLTVADVDHDPLADPGEKTLLRVDAVYPANTEHTGVFLGILPRSPCDAVLDLCTGTGIAALLASEKVGEAWAVDVTERATRFAEFNVRLNRASSVHVVQGDLWDAVSGKTFDRIVAHPPWVPNVSQDFVYRAGGDDGEQVTRRIVEGLPRHLRSGGTFYCSCMVTDREDAPAEERLRGMLGEAETEFDIALIARAVSTPAEYFAGRPGTRSDVDGRHIGEVRLLEHGVTQLVLSSFAIRRHEREGPAVTARRTAGEAVQNTHIEWLLEWESQILDPSLPLRMVDWTPRISPEVRMELRSLPRQDGWVPESCVLHITRPFRRRVELPLPVAQFLAGYDGELTLAEQLKRAKSLGVSPEHVTGPEFAATMVPLFASRVLVP